MKITNGNKNRVSGGWLLATGYVLSLALAAPALAFPDRPLTLVMPYPATGSPDIYGTTRLTKLTKTMNAFSTPSLTDSLALGLAQLLGEGLGQPVNFDRRPSENTIPGTLYAARAKPDGYTLLFSGNPTITIYPALYPRLPFKPLMDLAPVALFVRMPIALITATDNPAKTVSYVIERARLMPRQINYAVISDASTSHLTGALFRAMSATEMVHVNYNGSGAATNAVLSREVDFGFVPLTAVLPFLNSGAIRIIAVASAGRHPAIPLVPTIAESGLPAFEASGWFGIFAPVGTATSIVSRVNDAVNKILSEEIFQRSLIGQGLEPAPGTPEAFRALIEKDSERWSRILKNASVRP